MFQPEKFSDYVAILALLVSCASFYLSWRNFQRDTSRLKIVLGFEVQAGSGGRYTIRVINVGRRPASIARVYARHRDGSRHSVFDIATLLAETQFKDLTVPMAGLQDNHPLDIRAFEVEDISGKVYKAHTWKLWWRIRQIWRPEFDRT